MRLMAMKLAVDGVRAAAVWLQRCQTNRPAAPSCSQPDAWYAGYAINPPDTNPVSQYPTGFSIENWATAGQQNSPTVLASWWADGVNYTEQGTLTGANLKGL
jgi:hypothetical protein